MVRRFGVPQLAILGVAVSANSLVDCYAHCGKCADERHAAGSA